MIDGTVMEGSISVDLPRIAKRPGARKWEDAYHPIRFEDVVGQPSAVEAIARRVRDGNLSNRNIILHGPYGCGKTSLAEIVGRAMNCEDRQSSGSPCGACESCLEFDPRNHFYYKHRNCRRDGGIEMIREVLASSDALPALGSSKVFALDEVHGLSPAAFDALLTRLERPPDSTIFLLLTTQLEKIPETIQSRCRILEVELLDEGTARAHAQAICDSHEPAIAYDEEGLDLVVRHARGHVRDLVRDLESVAEAGSITGERVRRVLRLDYVDRLATYVRLVVEGANLSAQFARLDGWGEPAAIKAERIQGLLVYLLCNDELRVHRPDAVLAGITAESRTAIVAGIRARAATASIPVQTYWIDLVHHWQGAGVGWTESDFTVAVIRFDAVLNTPIPSLPKSRERAGSSHGDAGGQGQPRRRRVVRPRTGANGDERHAATLSPPFIGREAARSIWNAGSFLVQEHGKLLNTRITVRHALGHTVEHEEAAKLVGMLTHRLEQWLRRSSARSTGPHLPWIYVHEADADGQLRTTLVAHIDERHQAGAQGWLLKRKTKEGDSAQDWRTIHMRCTSCEDKDRQLKRHTAYLRLLCRGIDPSGSIDGMSLIAQLDVPKEWRQPAGRVGCAHRVRVAKCIGDSAQSQARAEALPVLSAFDEQAWKWLDGDWQLKEHEDRRAVRERRERETSAALKQLTGLSGMIATHAQDEIRAKLLLRWQHEETTRIRSWAGWWVDPFVREIPRV